MTSGDAGSVKCCAVGRPFGPGVYTLPMKHTLSMRVAALLLSFAAAAPAAVPELPRGAMLVAPETLAAAEPAALALEQRAGAALQAGDAPAAIALLAAETDPSVRELAADRLIERLRAGPPSVAGAALLDWLAARPAQVYRRHDETAADWFVPVFDLDGRARGTRLLWQQQAEREHWRERLAQAPQAALADLADADAGALARAAEAIAALTPEQHAGVRAALDGGSPAALWLASARRAPDLDAYRAVLARGGEAQQLELVASARIALPADAALRFLDAAAERPALASAAILALAPLAADHTPALERLDDLLSDREHGASAAAALARLPRPDRVQKIEALLETAPDATRATHLALALRLEGSPAAQAALRRLADDPRLPEGLRQELRQ